MKASSTNGPPLAALERPVVEVRAQEIDDYDQALPRMSSITRRTGDEMQPNEITMTDHGETIVGRIRVGFTSVGQVDTDVDIVTFLGARSSSEGTKWDGLDVRTGDAHLYPGGGHHQAVDLPGVDAVFAVVSQDALDEAIDDLGRRRRPLSQGRLEEDHASAFLRAHEVSVLNSDYSRILDTCARIASAESPVFPGTNRAKLSSNSIVRAAIDHAADTGSWLPSSLELCRATGVSERRLQMAFHDVYARPPSAFFRMRALSEARSRLRSVRNASPVATVAHDLGFHHLGRFSRAFRDQFGAYPSQFVRGDPIRSGISTV